MQPNQPNPDYSFLNNAPTQAGPSKRKRIMIVAGGAAVLLIIIFIGIFVLFGGGDSSSTSLNIAQKHTELIRVSELGQKTARGQAAKNIATTTNLTLLSSQAQINAIASKDQKVATKLLKAGQDAKTDTTLTEAEQRSQFDEVFIDLLVGEIKEYQIELKKAYESSNSKKNKETYSTLYDNLNKIVSATELSQ